MRAFVSRECSEREKLGEHPDFREGISFLSKTAVCERNGDLPGVVAAICFQVATALRHTLHPPDAPSSCVFYRHTCRGHGRPPDLAVVKGALPPWPHDATLWCSSCSARSSGARGASSSNGCLEHVESEAVSATLPLVTASLILGRSGADLPRDVKRCAFLYRSAA